MGVIVTYRIVFSLPSDWNQKYTLRPFTIPPKMVIVILPIVVLSSCEGRLPLVNAHTVLQHRVHIPTCRRVWIRRNRGNQITAAVSWICPKTALPSFDIPVSFRISLLKLSTRNCNSLPGFFHKVSRSTIASR